jgi:AsmA-like C-terminal region
VCAPSAMSDTILDSIPRVKASHPAPSRPSIWSRWPKRVLLVFVFVWIATEGISLAMQYTSLHKKLTHRLEAAFGRPVEVGHYDFSLWGGPVLEARSVSVAEDPRFGNEYFLRAESMSVRLRWQSVLRGRFELGTLSLIRPSMNLVRNAAGDWNLAQWLPRPDEAHLATEPVGPAFPSSQPYFRRIEIEGGRINFKRGDEKFPFAFVGVNGTVETDRPGRWQMDLVATPWRATVILQQAGTLHVSGDVGGTSSRLTPASLNISWRGASVSDVLRLARNDDDGVRGTLDLSINALKQNQDDGWTIQGRAQLRQLHRWDLTLRPDNPSVNLLVRIGWRPELSDLELMQVALEGPNSNAHGSGRIVWDTVRDTRLPTTDFAVTSSQIDMRDLLSWGRAFRPGVVDDLAVRGLVRARVAFSGWPPQLTNASMTSEGADFSRSLVPKVAHLGTVQFHYDRGIISVLPVGLVWGSPSGPPEGSLHVDAAFQPPPKRLSLWHLVISSDQMGDLIAGAAAFGWNISRGWGAAGPFACDLRWQGSTFPWRENSMSAGAAEGTPQPVGWLEFGASGARLSGATLRAPFLNQPIDQIRARAELKPNARHIVLESAQAFDTHWSGTFDRRDPGGEWRFAFAADHLTAAALDRWLNPAWKESLLDRMLPFLNVRPLAAPENLRATGHLSLDQFTVARLKVSKLEGDLKIEGRRIEFANASGEFSGGQIGGSFGADLEAMPVYQANLNFSRVDLSVLAATSPGLAGLFAGSATGEISLGARGTNRADLIASLACQGNADVATPELLRLPLRRFFSESADNANSTRFLTGSAEFSCSQKAVEFQKLALTLPNRWITGEGTIDFGRNSDLRFRVMTAFSNQPVTEFNLTGTLAAPRVDETPQPVARQRSR